MISRIITYFLENRLLTIILLISLILAGIVTSPFAWNVSVLPRQSVAVDAIPDIGENQQIVATEWMGRSPKDIQEQITYPLTTALMGIPGVKTIRSTSMLGMSFIYIIFNDNIDFYWSRSRILEKINSLPPNTLPEGVQPVLGPDATALGQIFWYTLEGRDPSTGEPKGGWNPQELRTIQDYYVKYSLLSAEGVSEVASAGGFVKEYQIELNPAALKAYQVSIMDVMNAVRKSNLDIGAETIELNKVEYIIRGLGYIKTLQDLEQTVVAVRNNLPVRLKDIAFVTFGPAPRRGGLDKAGVEAVGAVVVARYGSNPMQVIQNVKEKIKEIDAGLPQKTLPDGSISKVTIVPFYDRTGLIKETIGTLEAALTHEVLISIIVIIVLVMNLRASLIISGLLPVAVLMTFIVMRIFNVDANIVALSGIAIAIGVMVDVGIIYVENILRHLEQTDKHNITRHALYDLIKKATLEVSPAVTTALATTIISFLPVFVMQSTEGKLFKPLAFTKTFAIGASFILGLVILPTLAHLIFSIRFNAKKIKLAWNGLLILAGLIFCLAYKVYPAIALIAIGINNIFEDRWPDKWKKWVTYINPAIVLLVALYYLTVEWLPFGPQNGLIVNFVFVTLIVAIILLALMSMVIYYEKIIRWCLENKSKFLIIPLITLLFGILAWQGTAKVFGFVPAILEKFGWKEFKETTVWKTASELFPGVGKEFMPSLNEGSFLLMPTSMPHTGIQKNLEYIEAIDKRLMSIPEVEIAVGKWGRVNSALDPAPIQMFENIVNYRPEYILDENGHRKRFKVDDNGNYVLNIDKIRDLIEKGAFGKRFNKLKIEGKIYNIDQLSEINYNRSEASFNVRFGSEWHLIILNNQIDDGYDNDFFKYLFRHISDFLIHDKSGQYFRQWRDHIKNTSDIWDEIVKVTQLPGLTSAPKLQPIETRLIMLSTGIRASMGIKIYGPTLESIEQAGLMIENALKEVPSIKSSSVFYDRAVGAPYIEIKLNREAMARYGMSISDVQEVLQVALGGMTLTNTVEGRERYAVRVRYARELRDNPEQVKRILIPTTYGTQIPLSEIASIEYNRGAQMIQSENTFLVGYVIFDKIESKAEVDVVEEAEAYLKTKIASGELKLPSGVTYGFTGNYEHQIRATKQLAIIIPVSLIIIFLLLYFRFRTITASFIHFSGVFVALSGGFILIWLYGQPWFMNFSIAGVNLRDLFQMHTINLSVAVWVGFIALFGIATNDGVIMGTYIHQIFEERKPNTISEVREAVIMAGKKRVRPAMMTTAVAVIALLPVLTSTGKGAEIMVPMAIPTFGGMLIQVMTIFVVPVFQAIWRERAVTKNQKLNKSIV